MLYPKYEVFKDVSKQFRFRLKSKNYEIILASSEGYINKSDCLNAVGICQVNSQYDAYIEKRTTASGKYYFVVQSTNWKDIGRSEDYNTIAARDEGIRDVKRDAVTRNIEDLTTVSV